MTIPTSLRRLTAVLLCFLFLSAPLMAAAQEKGAGNNEEDLSFLDEIEDEGNGIADPLRPWNYLMFQLNDKLYFWLFKPSAILYRETVHPQIRIWIGNFFRNLSAPIRMVNNFLQGKGCEAGNEMTRFLVNSTVGIGGLLDPAKFILPKPAPPEEDLGQTLAKYKIGNGFYIVWPILGPSTLRDTVGFLGDAVIDPVPYAAPVGSSIVRSAGETLNTYSFRIGDYESFKAATVAPYESMRDGYLQHRNREIRR